MVVNPIGLAIHVRNFRVVTALVTIVKGIAGNRNIALAVWTDPLAEVGWVLSLASSQHAGQQC